MELQHLADFNTGGTKQAEVGHKAESTALKVDDAEQSAPFKDQVQKQIDQAKAESKQDKNNNNQQDSNLDGDVTTAEVTSDSEPQVAQAETPEDLESSENTQLKTDNDRVENEVIAFNNMLNVTLAPVETVDDSVLAIAPALPAVGKLLPLVTATPLQVENQPSVLSKEVPASPQVALTQIAAVHAAVAAPHAAVAAPITTAIATTDTELAAVDSNAFKSVGITEKPSFLNTQGSIVKSDLPTAEMVANASRMQQVPIATALSNSFSAGPNINAAPISASIDTGVSLSGATPLSSSLSTAIGAHVQGSEWPRQMTEQVSVMIKGGLQQAEIKLNPAHLGPLEVKLNISDDKANISFVTQHAPVRDAIDSAMPRLRDMLGEQGISLVDVDVSTQSEQQQANDDAQQTFGSNLGENISETDVDAAAKSGIISVELDVETGVNLYA